MRALIGLARFAPEQVTGKTVCTLVAYGTALVIPAYVAHVVDRLLTGDVGAQLAVLAGLLVLGAVAEAAGEVVGVSAEARVGVALRFRLLRHAFALGVPRLRQYATGDLVTRLTGNAGKGAKAVPYMAEVALVVLTSLVGLAALFVIDWRLGLTFVVAVVPLVLLIRRLIGRSSSAFGDYLEHLAAIAARLTETLAGSRTIRACGTGRHEVARVLTPMPDLVRAGLATLEVRRAVSWQLGFALIAVRVVVLAVAGLGVAAGRISPGDFVASALYLTVALGAVGQVDTLFFLADSQASTARVHDVLSSPAPDHIGRTSVLPPGHGRLSFRQVRLALGDRTVLDGVDLDVPAGASVAVVGRSGAGKTTLALVAGGLVDPDEGDVLIDGVAVRSLAPAGLRAAVGYAFDSPVLLGDTVRAAITFGSADASAERAARIAQAEDFVRRLPSGFDTRLADAPFSGGEVQRLGLARAVAHGGRVLVLDDATSALDTITEAKLAAALTDGLAGQTRLVIAHRAVTAARADLVAWLENGRVRALAPHHELWVGEPEYRAVFTGEGE